MTPRGPSKRRAIFAFVLFGAVLGGYSVRAPDIQHQLNLSAGDFGLALIGLPVGIILASACLSGLVSAMGPWRAVTVFGTLFALAPVLTALAGSGPSLSLALLLQGVVLSLFNIAINLLASDVSRRTEGAVLLRCHAFWGVAMLASTALGAQLIAWGISVLSQFVAMGALFTAALIAINLRRPHSPPEAPSDRDSAAAAIRLVLPGKAVLQIFLLGAALIAVEGIMRNWVIIHIRDSVGGPAELAATSLTLFVLFQTAGRFAAATLLHRLGGRGLHRATLALCALGTAGLALAPNVWSALAATCATGLAVSTIFPQSVAALADHDTASSTDNIAAFTLLQTLAVYTAPVLFGMLSDAIGYRASFNLLSCASLLTLLIVITLQQRGTPFADFQK